MASFFFLFIIDNKPFVTFYLKSRLIFTVEYDTYFGYKNNRKIWNFLDLLLDLQTDHFNVPINKCIRRFLNTKMIIIKMVILDAYSPFKPFKCLKSSFHSIGPYFSFRTKKENCTRIHI